VNAGTDLGVSVDGGVVQRRVILQSSHVHVGPGVEQLTSYVQPAVITRLMQRCPA